MLLSKTALGAFFLPARIAPGARPRHYPGPHYEWKIKVVKSSRNWCQWKEHKILSNFSYKDLSLKTKRSEVILILIRSRDPTLWKWPKKAWFSYKNRNTVKTTHHNDKKTWEMGRRKHQESVEITRSPYTRIFFPICDVIGLPSPVPAHLAPERSNIDNFTNHRDIDLKFATVLFFWPGNRLVISILDDSVKLSSSVTSHGITGWGVGGIWSKFGH